MRENGESLVMLPLKEFEELQSGTVQLKQMNEADLLSKINEDITDWKNMAFKQDGPDNPPEIYPESAPTIAKGGRQRPAVVRNSPFSRPVDTSVDSSGSGVLKPGESVRLSGAPHNLPTSSDELLGKIARSTAGSQEVYDEGFSEANNTELSVDPFDINDYLEEPIG